MGKILKKKKKEAQVDEETSEVNEVVDDDIFDIADDELLDEPLPEWEEDENAKLENKGDAEEGSSFKVLGEPDFIELKKIKITSSWVDSATTFPAELSENNLAELGDVTGLPKKLKKKVKENISKWFPVQKSVLPILLSDISRPPALRPRDVTISAPTGSGKTMCYLIPALAAIGERPSGILSSIIIVPVQTLVRQIEEEFKKFNAYDAKIIGLASGVDFEKELKKITDKDGRANCDIIISTPSRLVDYLTDVRNPLDLSYLRYLIVDEADRMGPQLRMEWLNLIEHRSGGDLRVVNLFDILATRRAPQKILLSATISKDVEELHNWNLFRPCLFKANATSSTQVDAPAVDHITGGGLALPSSIQHVIILAELSIQPLVLYNEIVSKKDWARILVFTNEKVSSARLARVLQHLSGESFKVEHLTSEIHATRRVKIMKRFKRGDTKVLICSDVLARGVDVPDIDCVVNYDLPTDDRLFVHRAGRTARAGKSGDLISIGDKDQNRRFVNMLKKTKLIANAVHKNVTSELLLDKMDTYQEALKKLQEEFGAGKVNGKVSGFTYRRHRKWIPGLKEKREAEREEMRAKWKKKKY